MRDVAALNQNIAFVPGDSFFAPGGDGAGYLRLNFANATPDRIREGIRRLARAAREQSVASLVG